MFVARSSVRIRFTRTAFVLAGLLPVVGLVSWAVYIRSAGHREAVRRAWEQAVGLPVGTAGIEHVRPGTIRARTCTLGAADRGTVLAADSVEVETTAAEVRVRLDALRCDAAGARLLAGLAAEWLERGARFRRDCVVEVADFAWRSAAGESPPAALRIECVAQGDARAVRVVLRAHDATEDEVRVVRTVGAHPSGGVTWQVEAACGQPLPYEILAAVAADAAIERLPLGTAATATGSLTASRGAGAWRGQAQGRLANVDLASCTGPLPGRAAGTAELLVRQFAWEDGRLLDCAVACRARDGRVEQRLLDALVSVVGCRPGTAFGGDGAGADRAFTEFACDLVVDGRGVEVRGAEHAAGAVVTNERGAVLHEPPGAVAPERIAWLLAAPSAVYVPSAGAGAWLMSILPLPDAVRERTSQSGPAAGSRDF